MNEPPHSPDGPGPFPPRVTNGPASMRLPVRHGEDVVEFGSEVNQGPWLEERHLRRRQRRVRLPIMLFIATCLSTFWVGATDWEPVLLGMNIDFRQLILRNWQQGLIYMGCVLAILLTHELGHFFTTLLYRIPASLPFFIPLPITPIGTMGAVIAMEGQRANRKEIFDIGLAGPLAGLIAAIPILWLGILQFDASATYGSTLYDCPLLIRWLASWLRPDLPPLTEIYSGQMNAYFMAGWVGLLITGLNMWPVSQLDGGHVVYALFGQRAHWIARGFIFVAITFVVLGDAMLWSPMIILVILMGTDHPRTANDRVTLGPVRQVLGCASLLIPVLCFPPYGIQPLMY